MDDIPAVGVLGVGTMGAGIVQLAAQTGHSVVACDQSIEALEKA
ncbi:MAG TPA: 3-hydroxyacyl-CoA dehydrogenase NAD-binding domain-containing protein [Rubrobacteraceae bacterium]|nr:3-hydroxyacyl-CoA dehydrogenase NAD-binding domain-containing protein [Rubrobacteraceae bacterium]